MEEGITSQMLPDDPTGGDPTSRLIPKIRPEGLLILHAGGSAGLFSAIIGGWVNGPKGTRHVDEVRALADDAVEAIVPALVS